MRRPQKKRVRRGGEGPQNNIWHYPVIAITYSQPLQPLILGLHKTDPILRQLWVGEGTWVYLSLLNYWPLVEPGRGVVIVFCCILPASHQSLLDNSKPMVAQTALAKLNGSKTQRHECGKGILWRMSVRQGSAGCKRGWGCMKLSNNTFNSFFIKKSWKTKQTGNIEDARSMN